MIRYFTHDSTVGGNHEDRPEDGEEDGGGFQKKCGEEMRRAGKTIVLGSHALGTVRGLCEGCVLLDGGWIASMGKTDGFLAEYIRVVGDETSSC